MPFNAMKKYNDLLELNHLSEYKRKETLEAIFDRDITNNSNFKFNEKIIRPIKKDGKPSLDTLFAHLTNKSTEKTDQHGRRYKSRTEFDIRRSERLHWIWHHIKNYNGVRVFSVNDRIKGRNKIRTYLYDIKEKYVIVLEPYRKTKDYYLLTAYYLEEGQGGSKSIENKYKRRLDEIY